MSRRAIDMQDLKDLKRTKTVFSPLDREGQALALRQPGSIPIRDQAIPNYKGSRATDSIARDRPSRYGSQPAVTF